MYCIQRTSAACPYKIFNQWACAKFNVFAIFVKKESMNYCDDEESVTKCWNMNADSWSRQVRKGLDGYRELLNNPNIFEFIGNLEKKIVLDAGCGEGYNTRILAKKGVKVTGVDVCEKLIDLAKELEEKEKLGIAYHIASLSDLSIFEDESFDAVVSFMVMMDVSNYEKSLSEINRVLKNNGDLFFSITHPCFTTKGLSWLKDENGNFSKATVSDYFNKEPFVDQWRFGSDQSNLAEEPFKLLCFPRTLSDYINGIIESGFTLKRVLEPRPSENDCKNRSWLRRWREHAALFIYFHAKKIM
jgi:2-polyprenyl-3-methyl-5-hydroxy-6-metoxy-1,4-benzoquinol methylase